MALGGRAERLSEPAVMKKAMSTESARAMDVPASVVHGGPVFARYGPPVTGSNWHADAEQSMVRK